MRDDAEHPVKHPDDEEPRVINAGLPSWFRAMIYVAGGLITGLGIAEARFVSRIEYQGHQDAQRQDSHNTNGILRTIALSILS